MNILQHFEFKKNSSKSTTTDHTDRKSHISVLKKEKTVPVEKDIATNDLKSSKAEKAVTKKQSSEQEEAMEIMSVFMSSLSLGKNK